MTIKHRPVNDYSRATLPIPGLSYRVPVTLCNHCGLLVGDKKIHDEWHRDNDKTNITISQAPLTFEPKEGR